jgi:hypothetical protein
LGHDAKGGFLFVNYQGTRQRSGLSPGTFISTTIPVMPADPTRSEASLIATFFPTGLPAGITGLDPVSVKLLQFKSNQFGGDANGNLIPSVAGTPGITVDPATCKASVNTAPFAVSRPGQFTDDQFTTSVADDEQNHRQPDAGGSAGEGDRGRPGTRDAARTGGGRGRARSTRPPRW